MAEKPFEPTQHRLERARREGDRPRVAELAGSAGFAAAVLALAVTLPLLSEASRAALVAATLGNATPLPFLALAALALAPCACAAASALALTVAVQGAPALRFPTPQLAHLNPVSGVRRILSRETAAGMLRAGFAGVCATCAFVPIVGTALVRAGGATAPELGAIALTAAERILAIAVALALAVALLEAAWERAKWRRRLRMDHDELKRELRQSEGDPLVRGRRRRSHGALVRGSLARLREASFVVANPAHVAVALEYRPPAVPVPRVLIRAVDEGAALVKARARELGIPLVEDPPLARALFAGTHVDGYIPRSLYDAVARIVAALLARRRLGE